MKNTLLATALIAGGLLASGTVGATTIIPIPAFTTTINGWLTEATDTFQQQDKLWTILGTDLPGTTVLDFTFTAIGTTEFHTLRVGTPTGFSSGTFTLDYTISIVPGTNRHFELGSIGADTSGVGGAANFLATKAITDINGVHNLQASNGVIGSTPLAGTFLTVHEVLNWTDGPFLSASNSFVQETDSVPEPASLFLFGIGLFGLMVFRHKSA